jgi:hypothetical protein
VCVQQRPPRIQASAARHGLLDEPVEELSRVLGGYLHPAYSGWVPVTVDEIRELAASLPRSYEAHVRGRVKFRIGQIVYLSLAPDGSTMGCGFPKEFRTAAVEAEPHKFELPSETDMRFNWIHVRLAAIDREEMRDLVEDAWARAVPKYVAEEYAARAGYRA